MKNLILIFMMLFAIDSIAQLDQREKGDVVSPALNKNPNFIQKTGWTIEAIDPINDNLCLVTPSSDNLTILTANACNARVYQDINSADIRKARFDKETMTALLKLQSLTYVKITLNVYKKAATTGTLTLLRTRSLENNSNVPLRDKKIIFDVVTEDLNFVTNANLADSLRIEFTFEPTVVFPAGVAKVEVNDFRVFSSPMNYSPLLHEVREESGMSLIGTVPFIWTGTNGTKGTTSRDEMWCGRQGQFMRLSFKYNNGSGGTAGTGSISLSIPTSCAGYSGLTVDTAVTPIVGSFQANVAGTTPAETIGALRTNYSGSEISLYAEGNKSLLNLTTSTSYFIADVLIPITQWKQSSLSISSQNDISNPKNHARFEALVTGSTINSQTPEGWLSSAVKSNENLSLTYSSSLELNTPMVCTAQRHVTDGSTAQAYSFVSVSRSLTSSGIRAFLTANSGVFNYPTNVQVIVECFKTGQDFVDAWKKTATAYLKESMIEKDVEQFHTDERKICDRCYKGGALYKKCFDNFPLTNNAILISGVAGRGSIYKMGWDQRWVSGTINNRFIVYPGYVNSTDHNLYTFSGGNMVNQCAGGGCSSFLYGCVEYSK